MIWEEVNVGQVVTTKKGFAFKSTKYVEKGVPVVRVSDYTMDSISNSDLKYYPSAEKHLYLEYELHEKDVIIQTVGSWQNNPASVVGKVVRVPYFLDGALLNQNAVKLTPTEGIDKNYLFYRLRTDEFKGHVIGEARGAANQASITLETIKSFRFRIPNYEAQRKIGAILSAYDNLIENNQKQIRLLEEAAQRLYKEWFVDLHFPGYENVPVVDGVPERWSKGTLGDIAEFKRGKTITKKQAAHGNIPVVAGGKEPAYYHNRPNTEAPVITVSASGNAGFARLYYERVWASDCSYLDISETSDLFFVYTFLKYKQEDIYAMQKGACQQHVNVKEINAMPTLIPSATILFNYSNVVMPYFKKIGALEKQKILLQQARDRLLPKLMSGEIEV